MPDIIKGYKINIPEVTGNVTIICTATSQDSGSKIYTVTNNLINCTNDNRSRYADEGSLYAAIIRPDSGYELINVAITMGGINVTSNAYTYQDGNAVIDITSVTGDIEITVQAAATSSGGGSTPPSSGGSEPVSGDVLSYMTYGKGINQTTGVITDNPECWATVTPVTVVIGRTYTITLDADVVGFTESFVSLAIVLYSAFYYGFTGKDMTSGVHFTYVNKSGDILGEFEQHGAGDKDAGESGNTEGEGIEQFL